MNPERYTFIVEKATNESECRTNVERAKFHYFNANGLYEKKKANDRLIRIAVEEGRCNSGALIAYGSSDDFYVQKLLKLAMNTFRVKRVDLLETLSGLQSQILKGDEFLKSIPNSK